MSAIYLAHPRHGFKVATLDLEAKQDEENGWTRMAAPDAAPVNMLARAAGDDTMASEAPRRRGRPRADKDD
jgi:hypothetical protein